MCIYACIPVRQHGTYVSMHAFSRGSMVHVCRVHQCRPAIMHESEDSLRSLPSSLLETVSCLLILAGQ